jgi:hypothetical protein
MGSIQRQSILTVLIAFQCLSCLAFSIAGTNAPLAGIPPVIIDYFNEAGCADCYRVKNQVMPELKERFEGYYSLTNFDVGVKSNVILLATYQEKLNIVSNKPVMMVVDYKHVFNGFDAIKAGLLARVDECIAERQEPGWNPPQPIKPRDKSILADRLKRFTLPVVVADGFLDGLNPCAIASLVFFMSMLAVAKVKGKGLLLMGISFCLASFVTYTALGLGLLRVLHLFSGFPVMKRIVDYSVMILLVIPALLSFRDAYRYKKTGNPDDVTLQLPESLKQRIHTIVREEVKAKNLVIGGVVIGVLVTALESVCTGQMYIPTLVVMAKSGAAKAWRYLLVYNLMFILPLVIVFVLTYFGLRTRTLLDWSRKNVVISKVLMGLFFLMLAVLVCVL